MNPKLIKDYGNNSLRKIKTDRADSRKIAKYGLANWSELRQYTSMDKRRYQLKVLNRQHSHLTSIRTSLMNNLIATLEMTYPDANKLFSSPAREDGTKSSRISKRGSPELRRTLFLVMISLLRTSPQDDPAYQFMNKKRAQGKPYLVYMTAGANKFLRVYYGRVKEHLTSSKQPAENNDRLNF